MEEGLVCSLKLSFEVLLEKYVANSCGRAAREMMWIGSDFAVLCRMLLMGFQRARGLHEED